MNSLDSGPFSVPPLRSWLIKCVLWLLSERCNNIDNIYVRYSYIIYGNKPHRLGSLLLCLQIGGLQMLPIIIGLRLVINDSNGLM